MTAAGDYRDIVITTLADEDAELREQVSSYRAVAQRAIQQLHAKAAVVERQRDTIGRLSEECRALRAALMQADDARAA